MAEGRGLFTVITTRENWNNLLILVKGDLRNVLVVHYFDDELVDAIEVGAAERVIRTAFSGDYRLLQIIRIQILVREDVVHVGVLNMVSIFGGEAPRCTVPRAPPPGYS